VVFGVVDFRQQPEAGAFFADEFFRLPGASVDREPGMSPWPLSS